MSVVALGRKFSLALLAILWLGGCRHEHDGHIPAPPFNKARGLDWYVKALAPAGDGSSKIYAGGSFTVYGTTDCRSIVRFNADGTLDSGFATGSSFNQDVNTITPAGDGSGGIYVGGPFTSYNGTGCSGIARINPDGTLDTAFASGSGFNISVKSIAPAGDGSGDVYVGGAFTSYNGTPCNRIARINSDGTFDTAFPMGSGFDAEVSAIAPAGDGSGDIYVGGGFTSYNGTATSFIARINSDGTLDAGFATGLGFNWRVISIAPASDGSGDIYVGGEFQSYNGSSCGSIARLNPDGTLDPAFAPPSGLTGWPQSIVTAADGSGDVYAGGDFFIGSPSVCKGLVRLNSDGTVDTAFNVGTGFHPSVEILCRAGDGSGDIIAGGKFASFNSTGCDRIARINPDGTLDPTFHVGAGFSLSVYAISMAGDGSGDVYVGGCFLAYNGDRCEYRARLHQDGTLDPGFSAGLGFNDAVHALAPTQDASGNTYWGGSFTQYGGVPAGRIARLNADGILDAGFTTGAGFNSWVRCIAPALDGSGDIYVGGAFSRFNGTDCAGIARLNPDGTLDPAFVTGSGFDSAVDAIVVLGDGSGDLYVGGRFTAYNGAACGRIVRINPDGTLDTTFATGLGFNYDVYALALAGDGSGDLYAGGHYASYNGTACNRIARLNSDGTLDTAFAVGAGFDNQVNSITLTEDGSGRIYVGGGFGYFNGTFQPGIVRIRPDGIIDPEFVAMAFKGAVFPVIPAGDSSGRIYVGGDFTRCNNAVMDFFGRLNANGTVD